MTKTKSTTKYYKFRGAASYGKLYEPDEYLNKKEWKINLHPDADTIAKIKAAGIQLHLKDKDIPNVDGKHFTFKRPVEKNFPSGITKFSPPEILDKDGKKLVSYTEVSDGGFEREGDPILIGNGSLVEIEVAVYQTKNFGKGCRLNSVKILDLIEYNPDIEEEVSVPEPEDEAPFESEPEPKKETSASTPKKSRKVNW